MVRPSLGLLGDRRMLQRVARDRAEEQVAVGEVVEQQRRRGRAAREDAGDHQLVERGQRDGRRGRADDGVDLCGDQLVDAGRRRLGSGALVSADQLDVLIVETAGLVDRVDGVRRRGDCPAGRSSCARRSGGSSTPIVSTPWMRRPARRFAGGGRRRSGRGPSDAAVRTAVAGATPTTVAAADRRAGGIVDHPACTDRGGASGSTRRRSDRRASELAAGRSSRPGPAPGGATGGDAGPALHATWCAGARRSPRSPAPASASPRASTSGSGSRRCCTSPPTSRRPPTRLDRGTRRARPLRAGVDGVGRRRRAGLRHAEGRDRRRRRQRRGEILLVQRADSGVWLYPTGWADVGYSPAEVAVKEVRRGDRHRVRAAAAARRDRRQRMGFSRFGMYMLLFHCTAIGGELRPHPLETSDVGWFGPTTPADRGRRQWWGPMAFGAINGERFATSFDGVRSPSTSSRRPSTSQIVRGGDGTPSASTPRRRLRAARSSATSASRS